MSKFRNALVALGLVIALPLGAAACDQPTIHLIIPFTPGASADRIGRLVAEQLEKETGKSLVVENRPGAGQILAYQVIAQSPPDGCTLGMITSALSLNPSLFSKLPYDTFADIDPIIRMVDLDLAIFVKPDSPIKSIAQLKAVPGSSVSHTFGTPGTGSMPHLAGGLINKNLPANLVHVPYKGLAPAKLDLLGGRLEMTIGAVSTELNSVKAGEERAVAVLSPKRLASLPDVPAVAEVAPGTTLSDYFGIAIRSGTPAPIRAALYKEIRQAIDAPSVVEQLNKIGLVPAADKPGALKQRVSDDAKWMADLVKHAGIKLN